MFLEFQKLLSILRLIVVECLFTVQNNCFYRFKFCFQHKKKFHKQKEVWRNFQKIAWSFRLIVVYLVLFWKSFFVFSFIVRA